MRKPVIRHTASDKGITENTAIIFRQNFPKTNVLDTHEPGVPKPYQMKQKCEKIFKNNLSFPPCQEV